MKSENTFKCKMCNSEFTSSGTKVLYCPSCRVIYHREQSRKWQKENRPKRVCRLCGSEFVDGGRHYCDACRQHMNKESKKKYRQNYKKPEKDTPKSKQKVKKQNVGFVANNTQCETCLYRWVSESGVVYCDYLCITGISRVKMDLGTPPNCRAYEKSTSRKRQKVKVNKI